MLEAGGGGRAVEGVDDVSGEDDGDWVGFGDVASADSEGGTESSESPPEVCKEEKREEDEELVGDGKLVRRKERRTRTRKGRTWIASLVHNLDLSIRHNHLNFHQRIHTQPILPRQESKPTRDHHSRPNRERREGNVVRSKSVAGRVRVDLLLNTSCSKRSVRERCW